MPSPLIKTSTLLDIARHSSKVIRISQYMLKTEAPLLIEKMAFLDQQSDPVDIVMALDNDLGVTANMLKSVALMVESLTAEHKAPELKAEESDFRALFPDNYDEKTQTLSLFGIPLRKSGDTSKRTAADIKAQLYQVAFATLEDRYPLEHYKKHVSLLKSLSVAPRPGPDSQFVESLSYATSLTQVRRWDDFYQFAMSQVGRFHDYRKSMTPRERELVDDKIYSGRTMLYGVVKTSTFITKSSGLEQISSRHKEYKGVIDKIVSLVKEIDCIRAVEIDQDASPSKIHDMLIDIQGMQLDFADAFELKARKLGQYRFSGYYVKGTTRNNDALVPMMGVSSAEFQLIAMDLSSPSVLAHELTHFRDKKETPFRTEIIEHFREKMDLTSLADAGYPVDTAYWGNHNEILARLGEVGFLLNKYGYQENESLQAFTDRVRNSEGHDPLQHKKLEYSVSSTASIDYYLGVNNPFSQQVFFNMETWTPAELSIVRDYTRNFFYNPDPKIQQRLAERLANGELTYQTRIFQKLKETSLPKKVRRTDNDDARSFFSKMQPEDVANVYQVGVSERLFADGEFAQAFRQHHLRVGLRPAQKSVGWAEWQMQADAAVALGAAVDPSKNPGDALILREMMIELALSMKALAVAAVPEGAMQRREVLRILGETVTAESRQSWGVTHKMTPRDVPHWVPRRSDSSEFNKIKATISSLALLLNERFEVATQSSPDLMMKSSAEAQFIWAAEQMCKIPQIHMPSLKSEHQLSLSQAQLLHVAKMDPNALQRYADSVRYAGLTRLVEPRELMLSMGDTELKVAFKLIEQGFFERFEIAPPDALKAKGILKELALSSSASNSVYGHLTSESAVNYVSRYERRRPVALLLDMAKSATGLSSDNLAVLSKESIQEAVKSLPEFGGELRDVLETQIIKVTPENDGYRSLALLNSPVARVFRSLLVTNDSPSQFGGPTKLMMQTASDLLVDEWVSLGIDGAETTSVRVKKYGDLELSYGESANSIEIKRTDALLRKVHAAAVAVVKGLPLPLQEGLPPLRSDTSLLLQSAHDEWKRIAEGAPTASALLLQSSHALSLFDRDVIEGPVGSNPTLEVMEKLSVIARQGSVFALVSQSGISDVRPLIESLEFERKDAPSISVEPLDVTPDLVRDIPGADIAPASIATKLGVVLDSVEPIVVEQDAPAAGDQPLSARNQMRLF